MTTWLVTGGAGFIGTNLVRLALGSSPERRVVVLDALTYAGRRENLSEFDASPRFCFVHDDICRRAGVEAVLERERPEAILHLAAESHVDRSIHDASPFLRTNVVGTQVLLDAARRFQVPRFLHVSTDEVYGSFQGAAGGWDESAPLAPNSPYAASKAASDLLVRAAFHTHGQPVVITRSSNNYG
ncbi:MAG: dTDP-glucose 4,6-dehydratase, partial [Terriglobales bacterium]